MEEQVAYLDNAATTRVCKQAAETAIKMMRECYGNPASLHKMGANSAKELARARESVAAVLGCDDECICFTSGGSESNNMAIFGGAQAKIRMGKKLVTTAAEHSSVTASMKCLEERGWTVTYITPGKDGRIDAKSVAEAVDEDTALVSMMLVNNETGALFPVEEATELIRAKNSNVLIHCDGVQAFGKIPIKATKFGIDLMSISSHKICGPKGAGALYIRRGARILPLIYGGGQERAMRSGTENLPSIAAFGVACAETYGKVEQNLRRANVLREYFLKKMSEFPEVNINSPAQASPYIMNISVPGYRSETLLHFLESRGVYVSSGSACSKGAASPVLIAMGLPAAFIDGAIRISFIYDTDESEIDMFAQALLEAIAKVAH